MTTPLPSKDNAPAPDDAPLVLRPSAELAHLPVPKAELAAPASAALPVPSAPQVTDPMAAVAQTHGDAGQPGPVVPGSRDSWMVGGAAVVFGLGWIIERRRRRMLETEKDSVLWADVQPPGPSIVTTAHGLDDILPDNPNPAEAARAIYVTAIGETTSRREATLIDLHQLDGKLARRRTRGDAFAAVLLLQQHLADFRYTSPWAFLELRELYKSLGRQKEWEIARQAFRHRFGQNAPGWDAASTAGSGLLEDKHLCTELAGHWPYREARMFMVRWMLGENEARHKGSGPPLLTLGVYRELLFLDAVLDDVLLTRPKPVDSLL